MLSIQSRIDYDEKYDVLYYCLLDTGNSYGDEIDGNIVILRDIETEQITGVTIIGFKKFFETSENKQSVLSNYLDITDIMKMDF